MPANRRGSLRFGVVHLWLSCCAGVCLLGWACSSQDDDGGEAGSGGIGADAGNPNGGSADGGLAGGEHGGAGAGGSGGRPEGGTSGGGQGGTCDEEITGNLIQRTLDEYCRGDHDCPRTLEAARRSVSGCGEYEFSEEETGCGYTVVSFYGEVFGQGFVFEGTTLVGAYSEGDVVDPLCNTRGEVGGIYPPICRGADRCRICDKEDGAAGEGPFCDFGGGGEGGRGGQGTG